MRCGGSIARGHEHRRPVHAVEPDDLLADDVVHVGPPGSEALVVGAEADGRGVVDERVVPDVEDVALGPRHRHAPGERGPGDRHVIEALAQEAEHLVPLALGGDDLRVRLDPVDEALLVAAQAEEVVLLAERGDGTAGVDRAVDAVDQLALLVVRLAGHAVRALVGVELDVAVVLDPLQELLHGRVVPRLGGADEVVVGDVEAVPGGPEPLGVAVGLLERAEPGLLGGLGHLQAVLVGAGQEEGVVTQQAVPAGQRVGDHGRVRVPHVGRVVHVVDRGGDVEPVGHRRSLRGPRRGIRRGCRARRAAEGAAVAARPPAAVAQRRSGWDRRPGPGPKPQPHPMPRGAAGAGPSRSARPRRRRPPGRPHRPR